MRMVYRLNYISLPANNNPETMYVISKWYVKPGNKVKAGDALVAYEEDKSVVDIYSDYDGEIIEIYVQNDETAAPGTKLCSIG